MRAGLLSILILGFCFLAEGKPNNLGFSLQTGVLNGSYFGAQNGNISLASTIDLSAELVTSSRDSFFARSSMSLDPQTAIIRYLYAGVGQRFYLFSRSNRQPFEIGTSKLEVIPKMQYFVSGEAGVSQNVIQQLTSSLSVQSTSIEYGIGLGMTYPWSDGIGLTVSGGIGKGIGISAVAVDSTIIRAMLGLTIK